MKTLKNIILILSIIAFTSINILEITQAIEVYQVINYGILPLVVIAAFISNKISNSLFDAVDKVDRQEDKMQKNNYLIIS